MKTDYRYMGGVVACFLLTAAVSGLLATPTLGGQMDAPGRVYTRDVEGLSVSNGGDDDEPPVVDIVNPREGYLHFSGLPLLPNPLGFIADTMSPGGFRLGPVAVEATDNVDQPEELDVDIYIDGEKRGDASWDGQEQRHLWKWTGWGLGTYTLEARAGDGSGNVGSAEMTVWYFCFIP